MKEVLYISYDGLTDALGQSQILPYIIGLTKHGYSFTVISCEKPDKFEKGKNHIEAICKENKIDWHPLIYHKKPPVISTIRDVHQIRKKTFQLHQIKKFSLIHCRSYISSLVGLEMKRKKNVPFIFDMRGFWADERVDGNLWDLKNPVYRLVYWFFKSKEAAFVQHSDVVVSLTEAGKKVMMRWPTMQHSKKISVIPCSVDMHLFDRSRLDTTQLEQIRKEINSKLVIGYYGSLGTWYMLKEMLLQFKKIANQHSNAKFLIVSNDPWQSSFDQRAAKVGISKEQLHITHASRNEMPYYIAATDVALFFIKPCFSKLSSSPTKHGEIMSMGVPLITNGGVGDMESIVLETNSGTIIDDFTDASLVIAANDVPQLLQRDKNKIREAAKNYYALEGAVKKYSDIYQSITGA